MTSRLYNVYPSCQHKETSVWSFGHRPVMGLALLGKWNRGSEEWLALFIKSKEMYLLDQIWSHLLWTYCCTGGTKISCDSHEQSGKQEYSLNVRLFLWHKLEHQSGQSAHRFSTCSLFQSCSMSPVAWIWTCYLSAWDKLPDFVIGTSSDSPNP